MSVRLVFLLSFLQRHTVMLLRLASMVVLARLLTPAEIGVSVGALALLALGLIIAEFGARSYLIQAGTASRADRSAALGVSLLASALVAAGTVAAGLLAPDALLPPEMRRALLVLTASLLVHPLAMTATAMLQRELRFGAIYVVAAVAALVGQGLAVVLALRGAGYMSPVWGAVAEAVVTALLACVFCPPVWPSLRRPVEVFSFGWVWTAIAAMRSSAEAAQRLAVTALLGLAGVGLVSRAQAVVGLVDRLLMEAVMPVVLPTLSEQTRSGRDLAGAFVAQFAMLSAVCWPAFGFIALFADSLVLLLLGEQWSRAVPAVRWLCLSGFFIPFSGLAAEFLVARGALRSLLPRQLLVQVATTLLVVAGAAISLEAVCAAIALEGGLKTIAVYGLLKRHVAPPRRALVLAFGRGVLVTGAALAGPALFAAAAGAGRLDVWAALFGAAAAAVLAWGLAVIVSGHPAGDELRRAGGLVSRRLGQTVA